MSAISRLREADRDMRASMAKLNLLRRELDIPDTNHTWSKARMFLQDAIDRMPRCACGTVTDFACSDCMIDNGVAVYVCERKSCRSDHERLCPCSQLVVES